MAEKSSELDYTDEVDTQLARRDSDEDNDDLLEIRSEEEALETTAETDDAEQIRSQIEETRSQMSETIDAIQDKLSFANISEQVKDQVSEQIGSAVEGAKDALLDNAVSAVNSVGRSFKQIGKSEAAGKVRQNPWIFSVLGLGVGAVLVNSVFGGRKKKVYEYHPENTSRNSKISGEIVRRSQTDEREDHKYQPLRADVERETSHSEHSDIEKHTSGSIYESVGSAASGVLGGVTGAAGTAYESVGGAAGKTYKGIGKASSYAYEKAGDLGGEMKKNYNHYIEENPLAVGAVALAVGAAVGFAIPLTKKENEYMGELRDNVVEKAQTTAQDAIGSVKQVASDAQKMIVEEVKSQTAS